MQDNNCQLLYNLDFCSEVAYAVPSNPDKNNTELAQIYDSNAQDYYQNFAYSLSLIQCNTSSVSLYSLAVSCTDCAAAYKQWLCSVFIPRCYDWSSNYSYLMPRAAAQPFLNGTSLPADDPLALSPITNRSRNPLIDTQIKPGPYKEILPCHDLCSDMVRTCPSDLGFKCPKGKWLNDSYGHRSANGDITCSYLGAAYYLNSAFRILSPGIDLALVISALWMVFWIGF
jgi:calcium channel MID1